MSDGWGSRNEGLAHLFPGSRVGSFWFLLKECKRQGTFKADLFTLAFVTDSDDWLMMLMLLCCYVALRSLCFGIQFPANGSLCIVVPISLQRMGVKLQAEQAVAGTLRVTIHAGSMPQLAGPDFEELGSNSAKPGTIEQGQLFNIVYIVSTFSRLNEDWPIVNLSEWPWCVFLLTLRNSWRIGSLWLNGGQKSLHCRYWYGQLDQKGRRFLLGPWGYQ